MNRTVKNRDVNHPKPVQKITLSEKHSKARFILAAVLAAVGVIALTYAFISYLSADSGWTEIKANASSDMANCSEDFIFQYYLGSDGIDATAENKLLVKLYTEATQKAYQLFHSNQIFPGVNNIYYINCHPNEVIEVDEVLYQAFSLLERYDNRGIYLAPVYAEYFNLFYCNDDSETINYDPYQNPEVQSYFSELTTFAQNPQEIEIQLLGENKIKLYVSDSYMAYAKETGFTGFIDFFWMKNAFIIDYIADVMLENNYTKGNISSYDGFVRNLDKSGNNYSFTVFNREEQTIYPAGIMQYDKGVSIVYARNYPMNSKDSQHYYELQNGEIRTSYIDISDGFCKSAVNNLILYSYEESCAEVLMQMIPVYISDSFSKERVSGLRTEGIYAVYCEDRKIVYNDDSLTLADLYDKDGVQYISYLE